MTSNEWIEDDSFDDDCISNTFPLTKEQSEIVNYELSENSSLKVVSLSQGQVKPLLF
jgi:hypothetical protein